MYADSSLDYSHCKRPAKCVKVPDATCMGVPVPYLTSFDLVPGATYADYGFIKDKLSALQGLEHIPKCWAVLRPFLCSVFMPKCFNDTVDLPSQEMCKKVANACRIATNSTIWPGFVRCANDKLFPRQCKNDVREMKFNTTGRCLSPLVPTDNALAVFEGIEGCGMPCSDPLYTDEEKHRIHSIVMWGASICFFANLFTVLTFLVNWRSSNKYPAVTVFYMNFCFMVSCLGWLLQFFKSRESIVCRKDGTLRMSEPNGEDLWCVVVFVMIYYSSLAAMIWLVIFSCTWFMTTKATSNIQGQIDKSAAYFHLLAWCLPLMFTVSSMAVDAIDGNYVTGICFVGYDNIALRAFFVLGPVMLTATIVAFFFVKGLIKLITLRKDSEEMTLKNNSLQIQSNIKKIGFFFAFILIAVGMTCYSHHYEYSNAHEWKQSFRDFITCSIITKYADSSECKLEQRPRSAKLQMHLLVFFVFGTLSSFWVCTTSSTIHTWTRFFKWLFGHEDEDQPIKMTRHKMISQAYAKRKEFDNTGRLSFNMPDDPVGLNLDGNSEASQGLSSTFAAALLTRLVNRRGAMVDRTDSMSSRRSSEDSQFSVSLCRVAVNGSRRNSGDSQIALSISEIKADFTSKPAKTRRKKKKKVSRKSLKRLTARDDHESSMSSINLDSHRMIMPAPEMRNVEAQGESAAATEIQDLAKWIEEIIEKR